MKKQVQNHRKQLKANEYNRRKAIKERRKKEDIELAKREERLKEQEEECKRVRQALIKEMQLTKDPKRRSMIKASLDRLREAPEVNLSLQSPRLSLLSAGK